MSGTPKFICVGPGKTGTTWLWHQLRRHESVYLPHSKEINYFNAEATEDPKVRNPNARRPLEWYLRHFASSNADHVCGEFSPSYFWSHTAARRIADFDRKMKIIVMLRDPVERSHSHHLYRQQVGAGKPMGFGEAIERYPFIIERSLYADNLKRYLHLFSTDLVIVLFFEDLKKKPAHLLKQVTRFLGVSELEPDRADQGINKTGRAKYPRLNRILALARVHAKRYAPNVVADAARSVGLQQAVHDIRTTAVPFDAPPEIPREVEIMLRRYFRRDVDALEELVGRDLSLWKSHTSA